MEAERWKNKLNGNADWLKMHLLFFARLFPDCSYPEQPQSSTPYNDD